MEAGGLHEGGDCGGGGIKGGGCGGHLHRGPRALQYDVKLCEVSQARREREGGGRVAVEDPHSPAPPTPPQAIGAVWGNGTVNAPYACPLDAWKPLSSYVKDGTYSTVAVPVMMKV